MVVHQTYIEVPKHKFSKPRTGPYDSNDCRGLLRALKLRRSAMCKETHDTKRRQAPEERQVYRSGTEIVLFSSNDQVPINRDLIVAGKRALACGELLYPWRSSGALNHVSTVDDAEI